LLPIPPAEPHVPQLATQPPPAHAPDPPRHLASPEPRTSLTSPLPTTCWPRRRGHSAAAPQREHKVQHGAALDVVIRRFLVVGHLLAAEDETLLRRGDALLLLNPLLNPGDRFVALDVDLDFLAGQRLDLDLRGWGGKLCDTVSGAEWGRRIGGEAAQGGPPRRGGGRVRRASRPAWLPENSCSSGAEAAAFDRDDKTNNGGRASSAEEGA